MSIAAEISLEDLMKDDELLRQFAAHVMRRVDWRAEFNTFCAERRAQERARIKVVAGKDFELF